MYKGSRNRKIWCLWYAWKISDVLITLLNSKHPHMIHPISREGWGFLVLLKTCLICLSSFVRRINRGLNGGTLDWTGNESNLQGNILVCKGMGHHNGPMAHLLIKCIQNWQKWWAICQNNGPWSKMDGPMNSYLRS